MRALVVAVGLAMVGGAAAAAGTARSDTAAYGGYLSQLSSEVSALSNGAGGAGSMAPRFIDFGAATDVSGLAAGDQALVRAMGRTYDVFRALGGTSDRRGVVERDDGRVYVGLDGEGGRWFADVASAAAFLLAELVESAPDVPESVREAVSDAAATGGCGVACIAETAYREFVKLIAFVPRGTTVALTLVAEGLSADAGTPVVEATKGFVVHTVTFVDATTLSVKLSIATNAPTGRATLSVFNAAQAFRPLESFAIRVVDSVEQLDADQSVAVLPGSGVLEPLSDDHAGDAADATALADETPGRIESSGDVDTFRIVADQPGTLTIVTSGSADVQLTLRDDLGNILANNDDSAAWYNARVSSAVAAGTYFVSVSHCCGGIGHYAVSATLQ
ncbi:MAG: PPC domain-containing protein [Proteobacteria bacterium]|nr:PPC domain-containing protein [Pseudomonadota bacterium]MDA1059576.1 PPC domain-containing protein [Pseudomonadota bacterium]